jgi:DNA-binding transcriptional LysR family regulator
MDLAGLQAFVEVARSGSFSAAAEALYLSQPAVSKRVAALEQELATPLFDRVGRRVTLTEAGRSLLPRAQRLLNEAADLRRLAADLSGETTGPLLMATSHHIGLHRLPSVLRAYTRRYPKVLLDIRFMDSEAICRAVQAGDIQLGVVTLPPSGDLPNLLSIPVWHDPLAFAVAPDHPLAAAPRPTLRSLARHPAVLPSPTTYTREILEQAMRRAGVAPHVSMSTNYLETLKMLVATGLGWSLLPETMLDASIRALPLRSPRLTRELGIVVHRQRSLSNAERAMIAACRAAANGTPEEGPSPT